MKALDVKVTDDGATKPPRHLRARGRELWIALDVEFRVDDPAGRALLLSACEARDRIEEARKAIREHGVVVKDRFGELRANPACQVETSARAAMTRALSALRLSPGDE